jgi:hypothetical protein
LALPARAVAISVKLADLTLTKAVIKATKKIDSGRVPFEKIFEDFFDHNAFFHDACPCFCIKMDYNVIVKHKG